MPVLHRQVLCGTSIETQIFVTADDLSYEWACPQPSSHREVPEERLTESDEALAAVAREQMLIYWHLRYASAQVSRSIVPLARERAPRSTEATGILVPLEGDVATAEVRQTLRRRANVGVPSVRSPDIDDFLTAPVPDTSIRVGMSRRLYGACERLDQSDRAVLMRIADEESTGGIVRADRIDRDADREIDEIRTRRLTRYREATEERHGELRQELRDGFNSAAEQSWDRLTGNDDIPVSLSDEQRIEAAAPDIYLAIDPSDPVVSSMPR